MKRELVLAAACLLLTACAARGEGPSSPGIDPGAAPVQEQETSSQGDGLVQVTVPFHWGRNKEDPRWALTFRCPEGWQAEKGSLSLGEKKIGGTGCLSPTTI